MQFILQKLHLLAFLTARIPRHGWNQWWTGLRQRRVGYVAQAMAGFLPPEAEYIVDVGAHHGEVAAALDLLFTPHRLLVVEPNPQLTARLRTRFRGATHISVVPVCLGEVAGEVVLHLHQFDAASSLYSLKPGHLEQMGFPGAHAPVTVPMTSLQRLLAEEQLPRVDFLKLDCQGAELSVLRGAGDRLREVRWILCEVSFETIYANAPLFGEVHDFLLKAGFELRHLDGFAGTGRSIQWGDALYANTRLST